MTKKKTVVSTVLFVMFMNIFVKVFSFTRDFLLGRIVGVGFEMDAYLTSLSITTRFFLAFGSAVITAMIPIIVKEKDSNFKKEKLTDIFNFLFALGLIVFIVYLLFTPQIISLYVSGYSSEKINLTVNLTRIMVPSVFFIITAYFFVGVMHCNQKYILATCTSIPYNVLIIAYIFIADEVNIYFLTFVTLLGWVGQMLVLLPSIIKLKAFKIKFRSFINDNTKNFLKSFILIYIVVSTIQTTNLTNNKFLSYFDDGVVSMYFYGNMIYNTITSLIVYGMTAVMFPKFNESFVNDKKQFFFYVERVLVIAILILFPICIGMNLVGDTMMRIIFLNENFPIENVLITSNFFKIFAFSSIAFGFIDILNKAYYAKDNKIQPIITTLILISCNALLNYLFIFVFGFNFYFVVISTVISYYISALYSLLRFKFENNIYVYKNLLITFTKAFLGSVVMYIAVTFVQKFINIQLENSIILNFVGLIVSVIFGLVVYVTILLILKEKVIVETFGKIFSKK